MFLPKLSIFVAVFCIFNNPVLSWKIFHNGRMKGGNLGKPAPTRQFVNLTSVKEEWFVQNLDHFAPTDSRLWKQRYFSNNEFYKEGGPVFLMIGGEGEASIKWMTQGAWVDYGKKFNALLFQLEHRYYGKSHPTLDMSTKNLRYLTSQQALADLATFIPAMNDKYKLTSDVKWIAFGGSYPGSLAAWLRAKYPHLVHGAMSASGPLLAEVDFEEYYQVIEASLAAYDDKCVGSIKDGFHQINLLLKQRIGHSFLDQTFNLCTPIETVIASPLDISNFFETIASNFAGVVQYNKDNRIGSPKGANITIDVVCDIMINETLGIPVVRLGEVNEVLLAAYEQNCTDYTYKNMIENLRNVTWGSESSEGGRQWMYQTCTEFGFYQTSTNPGYIFGNAFPVEFFVQQCSDIFGSKYNGDFLNAAVERTNTMYGGLGIQADNVVFVHGSVDPWHALGITKTVEQGAPAIYIQGTAHCANMYPQSDKDLPQLKAAREEIASLIDSWLRL